MATLTAGRAMAVQQDELGVAVMAKCSLLPDSLVVAAVTTRTEMSPVTFVVVILAMARHAILRRLDIFVIDVTVNALDLAVRMSESQGEPGLCMIEASVLPGVFVVAAGALLTKTALVSFAVVILAVACHTVARRLCVLDLDAVATSASSPSVLADQRKIGLGVVERCLFELDDFGFPTLVLGMAGAAFALLAFVQVAVVAGATAYIDGYYFVTVHAELALRRSVESHVAFLASAFELGMALNHQARHHRRLEALRGSARRVHDQHHSDDKSNASTRGQPRHERWR